MQLLLTSNLCATIDIVALILIVAYALYGAIRGFTKTFFSVFGTIIGVAIAILVAPSIVAFLQSKYGFVDSMSQNFSGVAGSIIGKDLSALPLSLATEENLGGVASFIANIVLSLKNNNNVSPDATIGQAVASIFGYYVVLAICVVLLFIILKIIFFIISEIVKKAYKNKLIASFDRTLGFVLGIINGIFNIEILLLLISVLPIPILQEITANVSATTLTKFIQDINLYQIIMVNIVNNNIIDVII